MQFASEATAAGEAGSEMSPSWIMATTTDLVPPPAAEAMPAPPATAGGGNALVGAAAALGAVAKAASAAVFLGALPGAGAIRDAETANNPLHLLSEAPHLSHACFAMLVAARVAICFPLCIGFAFAAGWRARTRLSVPVPRWGRRTLSPETRLPLVLFGPRCTASFGTPR